MQASAFGARGPDSGFYRGKAAMGVLCLGPLDASPNKGLRGSPRLPLYALGSRQSPTPVPVLEMKPARVGSSTEGLASVFLPLSRSRLGRGLWLGGTVFALAFQTLPNTWRLCCTLGQSRSTLLTNMPAQQRPLPRPEKPKLPRHKLTERRATTGCAGCRQPSRGKPVFPRKSCSEAPTAPQLALTC